MRWARALGPHSGSGFGKKRGANCPVAGSRVRRRWVWSLPRSTAFEKIGGGTAGGSLAAAAAAAAVGVVAVEEAWAGCGSWVGARARMQAGSKREKVAVRSRAHASGKVKSGAGGLG